MTFKHLIKELQAYTDNLSVEFTPNSISQKDYEHWKKQYTWDALLDQRYGQSFCNHFGIQDNRLYYERGWINCNSIIQREWLARP